MREPPGAAADREALKWALVELEQLILAQPSAWCQCRIQGELYAVRSHLIPWRVCPCWRCRALRIIRFSPQHGDYQWPQTPK